MGRSQARLLESRNDLVLVWSLKWWFFPACNIGSGENIYGLCHRFHCFRRMSYSLWPILNRGHTRWFAQTGSLRTTKPHTHAGQPDSPRKILGAVDSKPKPETLTETRALGWMIPRIHATRTYPSSFLHVWKLSFWQRNSSSVFETSFPGFYVNANEIVIRKNRWRDLQHPSSLFYNI